MSKHYGDIPCVKLSNEIHITISGSRCACGKEWAYAHKSRVGTFKNIIWRNKEAVTCPDCLAAYEKKQAEEEARIVMIMESCITYKSLPFKGKEKEDGTCAGGLTIYEQQLKKE